MITTLLGGLWAKIVKTAVRVGTLGALGGDFRGAQHPLSLTAIWQKWVLPELYTRCLLAIVGPVDSVNLWKTGFWEGSPSLWTALARRLPFWFASIFIGYAAKNREPTHRPKHFENALTTNQKLDTLTSVLDPRV